MKQLTFFSFSSFSSLELSDAKVYEPSSVKQLTLRYPEALAEYDRAIRLVPDLVTPQPASSLLSSQVLEGP